MPLPLPNLDDRRFDDLVVELEARLARHLPDAAPSAPGDPVHALVDLFAWLTETVIYRANQIPDRQRRAFLNLLQIPPRPARPARGLASIDALDDKGGLPPLIATESLMKAGQQSFTTRGEVQPTPLELHLLVKRSLSPETLAAEGVSVQQLRDQYGVEPAAFRPQTLIPGRDPLSAAGTCDGAFHLGLALPKALVRHADRVRRHLAGIVLNIGVAPLDDADGDVATALPPRRLRWDLAWWPPGAGPEDVDWLPLEMIADSSRGGRQSGVARLRLPRDPAFLVAPADLDPQFAGFGDGPPEPPAALQPGQLLFWLRLSCREEPGLTLGHLAVNAVDVVGQGIARDVMLGVGTGQPDQSLPLPDADVDPADFALEVEETGAFRPWRRVEHFSGCGPDDPAYVLDGGLRFGDGIRGKRPPANASIRAAFYRFGGGSGGNLPPGSIKELHGGSPRLKVRQDWPTRGGVDAESVDQAERRIPAFLGHRDRAVTGEDFAILARDNPVNPVGRAEAVPGFFPGASLRAVRRDVPGVVSVFVLPPAAPALGAAPRPSAGLLADVFEYLAARTLLGTELYVLSPRFRPVSLSLSLEVVDPATETQVFRAVERALLAYLWALPPGGPRGGGWPLGRPLEVNELRTVAGRVPGVEAVNQLRLFHLDPDAGRWRELSGQALPLADYELPEVMAIALQPGEGQPEPPRGHGPGAPAGGPAPVPVPVIPDIC